MRVNLVAHWAGRILYRLLGWKTEGQLPEMPQWVCIVAWHTSNWDFFYGLLASWVFRIHTSFLGKDTIFRGPVGWFLRKLGGIPVERTHHHNMVAAAVEAFRIRPHLIFVIAPEGTRHRLDYWKSGFYHIALQARVPIVLAYLDYGRRTCGFGPTFWPTGDIEADLAKIREFYSTVTTKHPELKSDVRFKDADAKTETGHSQII
jgi:1-acyl-sn-glycerol-3-phosphate acyltransferase